MRIYVAFRTDGDVVEKTASGSFTKLKEVMKSGGDGAEFTVVEYNFKPSLGNVCQAIMDVTELEAEHSQEFRVNSSGQLREVRS
jgi:hypothetical protein